MKWNMIYFPWCVWEFIIGEMKKKKKKKINWLLNNSSIICFILKLGFIFIFHLISLMGWAFLAPIFERNDHWGNRMTFIMIPYISIKFKPPNKWKNEILFKRIPWESILFFPFPTPNNKSQYQMWTKNSYTQMKYSQPTYGED